MSDNHGGAPIGVGGFPFCSPTGGSRCRSRHPTGIATGCTSIATLVSDCSSGFSYPSPVPDAVFQEPPSENAAVVGTYYAPIIPSAPEENLKKSPRGGAGETRDRLYVALLTGQTDGD